jgi:hypothetical protein
MQHLSAWNLSDGSRSGISNGFDAATLRFQILSVSWMQESSSCAPGVVLHG